MSNNYSTNNNKVNSDLSNLSAESFDNLLRIAYKHNSISAIEKLSKGFSKNLKNSKKDDQVAYLIGVLWSNNFGRKQLPMNKTDTVLMDCIFNVFQGKYQHDMQAIAFWHAKFPSYYNNYKLLCNIATKDKNSVKDFISTLNFYRREYDTRFDVDEYTINDFYNDLPSEWKLGVVI